MRKVGIDGVYSRDAWVRENIGQGGEKEGACMVYREGWDWGV